MTCIIRDKGRSRHRKEYGQCERLTRPKCLGGGPGADGGPSCCLPSQSYGWWMHTVLGDIMRPKMMCIMQIVVVKSVHRGILPSGRAMNREGTEKI